MKRKFLSVLLAATLAMSALTMAGCGSTKDTSSETTEDTTEEAVSEDEAVTDEEGEADTEETVALIELDEKYILDAADTGADDGSIRSDLTAIEFQKLMGNGIDLGNTMEAYGRDSLGIDAKPTQYETSWGQPVTTQEMIDGMKAAGFDMIRIPVAWTNMIDVESGDYTINTAYLERIKEIVDYARNADMYVMINDHWDGGWWGMFGSASEDTRAAARELYKDMWTQIATYFKDYSDFLIFEGGNEEIGYRLNDTDFGLAADSGTLSDEECYTVANEINQMFVDVVRSTGGNNTERFLLIPGFGTDISTTLNAAYVMPTDTATSKLLLSVHFYEPSGYCIFTSIADWGTQDDYDDMNRKLEALTTFTNNGYGVIIGECGVLMEDNELKDGTLAWMTNFYDNCDKYGYCPVLWDCNNQYDKSTCSMRYDDIADFYTARSNAAYEAAGYSDDDIVANAEASMDESYANADQGYVLDENTATAWIMFTSSDWGVQYSVGDVYDPTTATAGIVSVDPVVTGEGTYTASLDFTGTSGGYATGITFSAIGLSNGENLFPGYVIDVTEVKINGEAVELAGKPYTASDDGICSRVNLYNSWVTAIPDPEDFRTKDGSTDVTACPLPDSTLTENIETIEVTFDFIAQ